MPLGPGARLGPYEIVSAIGAGGMGEVYRARDTRLGRDVAIKALPASVARDPDRLARFEREAHLLASLNHPNIASIYHVEDADGSPALVMELVDGDTLADRIGREPIPLNDVLEIATQVAAALEAAHEQHVIHRDLKPSNIKLTSSGSVKVLDFGLARLADASSASGASAPNALSLSPTVTSPALLTGIGVLLGTAAYMAPEQARGQVADHRSDIFAFGCVLYEMLARRRAFAGDSTADVLASVIAREPDLAALPDDVNPRIIDLLRRCLDKNPKRRWQAIADVRSELEIIIEHPRVVTSAPRLSKRPLWQVSAAIAAVAAVATALGAAATWLLEAAPPARIVRFSLSLADGEQLTQIARGNLAVSPDGSRVAYIASPAAGPRLYLRSLSELESQPMAAPQEGLNEPAFSPDGQWIAFFADGAIRRMPITGGAALTVSAAATPNGLTWDNDGILYGHANQGIFRVSADGGMPQRLISVKEGEWVYGPRMLPDGKIVFTLSTGVTPEAWDAAQIVVQAAGSSERKVLVKGARDARYSPTGHLLYAVGGVLFAAPFDVRRAEITGAAVPLLDGVRRSTNTAAAHYALSESGTLIYIPGPTGATAGRVDIVVADGYRIVERLMIPTGPYEVPRVSPDGQHLAFGTAGSDQNISIYEFGGRTAPRRLTFGGHNRFPLWSADGKRVAFQSDREGDAGMFWQAADGTGTAERLTRAESGTSHIPETWSPVEDRILFSVVKGADSTLWTFSVTERKSQPLSGISSTYGQPFASSFSPDGKWFVYTVESRVYVQPFPQTGATYEVASGFHPWWSRDGKQLVFIPGFGRLGTVSISRQPTLTFTPPVFMVRPFNEKLGPTIGKNFDVTPDGKFIGLAAPGDAEAVNNRIAVVLNWQEELKRRVPVK